MTREIRLMLVDDHTLFRESLGRLLATTTEFRIVAQCATRAEAQQALSRVAIDVVLLDYDLGPETGMQLLTDLRRSYPGIRVLVVTAGLSDEGTLRLMEAGAEGIFLKQGNPDQLMVAIRQVAAGETWLDRVALQGLLDGRRARTENYDRSRPLTQRQSEVLCGILDGLANKEIAWKLGMSESSVKAVIQELFRKAGVRTRSQLVRIAIEKHSADWLQSSQEDKC
ncbi:MAG: response regulator transcription factor [Acidobacteriaceae bacterium]